jgi:hypothetical protein
VALGGGGGKERKEGAKGVFFFGWGGMEWNHSIPLSQNRSIPVFGLDKKLSRNRSIPVFGFGMG